MGSDEVLIWRDGAVGRIRLNRPRAINALTAQMVAEIAQALSAWEADDGVAAVALDGAGERGLCAGADIRALREQVLAGDGSALEFLRSEYLLNAMIDTFPKPYVAWMDGIVMGGGLGLSMHGSLRLVTERTRAAMPETGIGFLPDVGALFPLAHAPGELGTHVALTGADCTGADAIAVGMADGCVAPEVWPEVVATLAAGAAPHLTLDRPPSALLAQRCWIDECYAGDDAAVIRDRLLAHPDPQARAAGELLQTRSPLSVVVTLAALRRAASMRTVAEVLTQDLRLAETFMADSDFPEGVRSVLVDRDGTPAWRHADLRDVPAAVVAGLFDDPLST